MTIQISNPHLPTNNFVLFDAFNLVEGAAFMVLDEPDPRVWIVEKHVSDAVFERVYLWCHDGTFTYQEQPDLVFQKAMDYDYSHKVALVGIVHSPGNPDDNNWGQSFAQFNIVTEQSDEPWTAASDTVGRCNNCRGTDFLTNLREGRHTCP